MTALTVSDVDLYYGAAQALRGVSAKAESGKITCVLGRNGVGKSSLLRAIMGHQPIRKGAITLDEETLQGAPHARAGRGLAYVPQGREIFPLLTVKENLETGYARLPRRERRAQLLEVAAYLVRPDLHIAARWRSVTAGNLARALGRMAISEEETT